MTNGRYRLTQTIPPPPPGVGPWDVRVTDASMYCFPFYWSKIPGSETFTMAPGMGISCTGTGTYTGFGPQGEFSGTCVFLGP